jgi:hypothetical protein
MGCHGRTDFQIGMEHVEFEFNGSLGRSAWNKIRYFLCRSPKRWQSMADGAYRWPPSSCRETVQPRKTLTW